MIVGGASPALQIWCAQHTLQLKYQIAAPAKQRRARNDNHKMVCTHLDEARFAGEARRASSRGRAARSTVLFASPCRRRLNILSLALDLDFPAGVKEVEVFGEDFLAENRGCGLGVKVKLSAI